MKPLRPVWMVLAAVVLLAYGCGSSAAPLPKGAEGPPTVRQAHADSVAAWVEVPDTVPSAVPVQFRMVVKNRADRVVFLHLGGGSNILAFDFVVQHPDSSKVWRLSRGVPPPMAMFRRALTPGQELTFEYVWDQRDLRGEVVPPGRYVARGVLYFGTPQRFTIEPAGFVITAR